MAFLHSNCSLKRITNYTLLKNKTFKFGNTLYNVSQYVPLNDNVGVCIPADERMHIFPSYKWSEHLHKACEFNSYCGRSVSFICYSIIIIIYQFIVEEKSLSSKTVYTFLCLTLLVTNTAVLATGHLNHNPFWCECIGIFLHWLALAAQFWTPIITFDLLSKVRKASPVIVKTNPVRLAVYSATAYGITTIIIGATILLHTYQTNDTGYGGHDFCCIGNPQSQIYFDILPMFLIFLIKLIFSTHVLYYLWKRKRNHVKFYERLVDIRTIFFRFHFISL